MENYYVQHFNNLLKMKSSEYERKDSKYDFNSIKLFVHIFKFTQIVKE